jgi:hypothetical protein
MMYVVAITIGTMIIDTRLAGVAAVPPSHEWPSASATTDIGCGKNRQHRHNEKLSHNYSPRLPGVSM